MIARFEGPGVPVWLEGDETAVYRVSFTELSGATGSIAWMTAALRAYFNGQTDPFPGGLSFTPSGPVWLKTPQALQPSSPFERIYQAMAAVPYGQTLSYSQLAGQAGNPRWARAAGQACRRNPLPILLPCHRILASHGLGGYTPGLELKHRLLGLEGLKL